MKLKDLPQHHALLLVNTERDTFGFALFQELQAISPANVFFNHKVLDIEMAREVVSWAITPYHSEKIALISFNTIGLEAQNVLLKILEEPMNGVRFILLTSNKSKIIDTVLSRLCEVNVIGEEKSMKDDVHAEEFLKTPYSLRMKLPYVVDIISRVEKINGKERKDKEALRLFILALASVLERYHMNAKYIQETLEIASYVADPSSSGKALMEYLSLLLPQPAN